MYRKTGRGSFEWQPEKSESGPNFPRLEIGTAAIFQKEIRV